MLETCHDAVNELLSETFPPNRLLFEKKLDLYNASIKLLKNEIHENIKLCQNKNKNRDELKKQKSALVEELNNLKVIEGKLKENIETMKNQLLQLEKHCRIRNREQLEKDLSEMELRYETAKLSPRDETYLVNQMNILKRNKSNLGSLESLIGEKNCLQQQLKEIRKKKNEEVYHNITKTQISIKKNFHERKTLETKIVEMRQNLKNVYENRTRLIETYEANRAEYKNWVFEKKPMPGSSVVPMSFPLIKKSNFIDDEELEPFYEQKRDCKRLMTYLESLKKQMKLDDFSNSLQDENDDSDSADELPPNFPIKASTSVLSHQSSLSKKNLKKGKQPLSHDLGIFKLFGTIEVDVPNTFSDVPVALEKVKAKLDYYMQQTTNELDWGNEFNEIDFMSISLATTSELDSTFCETVSDIDSISNQT